MMKISMSFATLNVPFFLVCLLSLATTSSIGPGFTYGSYTGGGQHCRASERDGLLKLKDDLTDPSNRLASWDHHGDCCTWLGVVCHNVTGHVTHLLLRSLSPREYFEAFPDASPFDPGDDYEDYRRSFLLGGKINPCLLNLTHLMHLDLSNNDFGGIHIPKFIGSLGNLKYLNLSDAGFGGMIPHQLGNLSNLHYLNLHGGDYYYYESYVENLDWVSGLSSLEFLDLSQVDLSKAFDWLEVINKALPSLVELHLSSSQLPNHVPDPPVNLNFSSLSILDLSSNYFEQKFPSWVSHLKTLDSLNLASNYLQGPIPNDLQNLTSLRELDLSSNHFNSSIPNLLYGFSHLELLNLVGNNLQGEVSSAIGNMTSLTSLDLSGNYELEFNGGIPASFKNLRNLKFLSLSSLKLNQHIAEVFEILSDKLESLDLSDCQLFGGLTCSSHVGQFKNLTDLVLGNNQLNGSLPDCLGELASLRGLWLSNNRFSGTLPTSFNALTKLEEVDISDNMMVGDVFEFHFANLTKLQAFYAGGNQLTLRASSVDWVPPLQLRYLDLRSWNIGPQFPTWIRSLKYLYYLDLSNSSISSTVPTWFWNFSSQLHFLNLSHNHIQGVIPSNLELNFSGYYPLMDLSSNNFKGPLPSIFFNHVYSLDLSNNSFSGSIFNLLCSTKMHGIMKNMRFLNLGENLLSGEIPDCWMSWQYLIGIKLSNNRFSGNIPKSLGTLNSLESLHLRNNSLSGELPMSLQSCTELMTLDIGENEVRGNIPTWMGERLSSLVVLNMRANKFDGHIPNELCKLAALQILDLAHNSLSGSIPTCVNNFSAMATRHDFEGSIYVSSNGSTSYQENQLLVMKGTLAEYSSILRFVMSIDLSNNSLCGEIPTEITRLGELLSLNLSQNLLTGKIPKDIGAMRALESIDFSSNQLSGEIPQSMSKLTFLNHFNLSHNKLLGKIPLGTQLQSFDPSSYMGNQLCGPPLSKNCSEDGANQDVKNKRDEDGNGVEVNGFFVSIALGFIVGFWSTVGSLLFNRRWRYAYFHFLSTLWDRIWVAFHVSLTNWRQ